MVASKKFIEYVSKFGKIVWWWKVLRKRRKIENFKRKLKFESKKISTRKKSSRNFLEEKIKIS